MELVWSKGLSGSREIGLVFQYNLQSTAHGRMVAMAKDERRGRGISQGGRSREARDLKRAPPDAI